jgi:hypothetical protein
MTPISEVLEEAARECENYSADRWRAYKTSNAHSPDRANPYVEGQSDGASDCAAAIRALAAKYGDAILCEPEPSAWVVIDAAGYVSLFDDEGTAYEYAEFAHGPRPVHKLYRAKEPK